jgi:ASC-1-like (ASCH) protein
VKTFFSGSGPFVNRAMLVGAVQVGTYDQFRDMYKEMGVTSPLCKYSIAYIVRSMSVPFMSAV